MMNDGKKRIKVHLQRNDMMSIHDNEYKIRKYLESLSSEEYLNELKMDTYGQEKNIEVLKQIRKYNLPDSVLNVLIHYTTTVNDFELSRSFMERVASDWGRKRIETTEEAMQISKIKHKEYQEWLKQDRDNEEKQVVQLNKIERTKLKAIELAAKSSSMNNQDLGKFVRDIFSIGDR